MDEILAINFKTRGGPKSNRKRETAEDNILQTNEGILFVFTNKRYIHKQFFRLRSKVVQAIL
jgi:hypothetical protein